MAHRDGIRVTDRERRTILSQPVGWRDIQERREFDVHVPSRGVMNTLPQNPPVPALGTRTTYATASTTGRAGARRIEWSDLTRATGNGVEALASDWKPLPAGPTPLEDREAG